MALRMPRGGLISWGTFTFTANRSKVLAGQRVALPSTHSAVAGAQYKVDRAGNSIVPVEFTLPYEYRIHCAPGGSIHAVQTQFDTLLQTIAANPVRLLTCFAAGDITDTISGMARIEDITEVEGFPNRMTLNITFFCPSGMA